MLLTTTKEETRSEWSGYVWKQVLDRGGEMIGFIVDRLLRP